MGEIFQDTGTDNGLKCGLKCTGSKSEGVIIGNQKSIPKQTDGKKCLPITHRINDNISSSNKTKITQGKTTRGGANDLNRHVSK